MVATGGIDAGLYDDRDRLIRLPEPPERRLCGRAGGGTPPCRVVRLLVGS